MPQFNTILLPQTALFQVTNTPDGGFTATRDSSTLVDIVEEFVALSASRIAIRSTSLELAVVDSLPKQLANYVVVVDKNFMAEKETDSILQPLMDEIGAERDDPGHIYSDRTPEELMEPFAFLAYSLETFLIGLRNRCQIDIDIELALSATNYLRTNITSIEARANLAILEGIFSTYETVNVDGLRSVSKSKSETVNQFEQLLQDSLYQELSNNCSLRGIPPKIKNALANIRRLAARLLKQDGFNKLYTAGSKATTLATGIPMPETELAERLLESNYLPPIVDLKSAIEDVTKRKPGFAH